jgi:hypothetical protein
MTVKITDKALREFIRNRLLEEAGDDAETGDDSQAEEEGRPAVSNTAMDKVDIPTEDPDLEVPIEADPQVVDTNLGPPVADPMYLPQNMEELTVAVEKLLNDVPENSIPTAYKIVKKTLSNLHDVLRQRGEFAPSNMIGEATSVEKLLYLIVEQGYEMPDPMMKGEEEEEEEEEVEVRAATYGDDRKVSPPPTKEADPVDDKSQFDRFFKKKMEDMLALAKARYPEKLQGVADWNSVDDNLEPEEHLAVMDAYDDALGKKYPVLAKASGRDFEPPVKATLVAAVEEFMKSDVTPSTEASDDVPAADDKTDNRFTRAGALEQIPLGKKSSQDQATKEAIRRELYRMSVGTKDYYQGLIDIFRKPDVVGDKKLQKALDVALSDFSEEESAPESDSDYFLFITYINQDLRPDPKVNYRNTVLARAAEHMMSQAGFAGSKGKAERPHINKDSTLANLKASVAGIKDRADRADADRLEKLSDILNKMLPKGETVPVVNIRDVEADEEVEEKPVITLSPGGKTFRRKRPESAETEMAETMTPAEAILRSTAVNPDLDKALALVKGLM